MREPFGQLTVRFEGEEARHDCAGTGPKLAIIREGGELTRSQVRFDAREVAEDFLRAVREKSNGHDGFLTRQPFALALADGAVAVVEEVQEVHGGKPGRRTAPALRFRGSRA